MAAARYSTDVLQESYEPRQEERRVRNGEFALYTSDFDKMFHAWRMEITERDPTHNDLLMFARGCKEKFVKKVKEEIKHFKSIKVDFGMKV